MADRGATADAVEGHAHDLAVRLDILLELANRFARDSNTTPVEYEKGFAGGSASRMPLNVVTTGTPTLRISA